MTFGFSRISKTKFPRNLSGVYLQGHFFNHTACFVSGTFHWLTNRPSVLGADIPCQLRCQELPPESFQNETCYKLYSKYKFFSCFPTIYSSLVWKSFFNEMGVTYVIFHILKDVDWMLFQASADNLCYVPTILLYVSRIVILPNLWICSKNTTSSRDHYFWNCIVLHFVIFVSTNKI